MTINKPAIPKLFLDDANQPTYQRRVLPRSLNPCLLGYLGYRREMALRRWRNERFTARGGFIESIPEWEDLEIYPSDVIEGVESIPPFVIEDYMIPTIVEALISGGTATLDPINLPRKTVVQILASRNIATYKVNEDFSWNYSIII